MRGLMWRTDFPKDRAMIFILGEMRRIVMWMQNTPLPLDMVFLDDKGPVVAIHENAVPFSENLTSSEVPAAYAVELPGRYGQTHRHKSWRQGDPSRDLRRMPLLMPLQ